MHRLLYTNTARKMSKYGVFLVCISPYSVQIRENTDQKKLRIWTLFTQCIRRSFHYYFLIKCQEALVLHYFLPAMEEDIQVHIFKNGIKRHPQIVSKLLEVAVLQILQFAHELECEFLLLLKTLVLLLQRHQFVDKTAN